MPLGKQESGCTEKVLGALVDAMPNTQYYALAAKKANSILGCVNSSTDGRSRELIICLCYAPVRPYLQ